MLIFITYEFLSNKRGLTFSSNIFLLFSKTKNASIYLFRIEDILLSINVSFFAYLLTMLIDLFLKNEGLRLIYTLRLKSKWEEPFDFSRSRRLFFWSSSYLALLLPILGSDWYLFRDSIDRTGIPIFLLSQSYPFIYKIILT